MRAARALLFLALLALASATAATVPRLVAPNPDAALDAWLVGRFVALARPGNSASALSEAVSRCVSNGLLNGGNGAAADAPDLRHAALGVVTFKATAANAQAFLNANSALFAAVEQEQKISIVARAAAKKPPPPPLPPRPPLPPALNLTADTCSQAVSNSGLWGLDLLDRAGASYDSLYSWAPCAGGATAHVFIIDTGIYGHSQLLGRVSDISTCTVSSGCAWADDNGHGTHCSGTVGGTATGVHKGVMLHAVKVLSSSGSGTTSGVAAGVNWVSNTVASNPALRPAVVSMSLGGGLSSVIDTAVANLIAAGTPAAVAAGNSAADACRSSPAAVPAAVTVAASDVNSAHASFSNFGRCVDVYAPGVGVYSTVNAPESYATWSGTSMAAPHVAGALALMRAAKPCLSPAQLTSILTSTATASVVGAPTGTPNKLINARAAVEAAAASTLC